MAVIPVRAVLVPSDISQTTVIDYILGTEMAVMVASSLMIVVAGSIRPAASSIAKPEILPAGEAAALASNPSIVVNDTRTHRGLIAMILLGLTGIAALTRFRKLLSKAKNSRPAGYSS